MTKAGIIYVVGTPIGNLGDFPPRAQTVLAGVDLVLAEDTRHSRKLLDHFQLHPKLQTLHEHNERELAPRLISRLQAGESMALISDAGMPLVSDPGYILLHAAREAQVPVRVVPGPSAALAALAASGLPTDRFCFEGFLPPKPGARRDRLQALAAEQRTQIYFESPRRILDTLQDLADCFGLARPASLSRELTKIHEDTLRGSVGEILARLRDDPDSCRGEMVLVLGGAPAPRDGPELAPVLLPLLAALPLSQAVAVAVQITGLPRKQVYAEALRIKED
ncbi:16S rRNA (cytidine(1402)-2'-O)-methyltransferase [Thermithiobacillus plumbiphilus]|uniref:Ribosomal RNA small subunit methyltransferase I n=1 Tax=Thermithiobacillus plumbiphilus TaxID=1729899 RepID=A0ABU9D5U1_9PROT